MKRISLRRGDFIDELTQQDSLWLFAYGSLMWKQDFEVTEVHSFKLRGWERSLCIYSYVHRGSRRFPGLVFGLKKGGFCRGVILNLGFEDLSIGEKRAILSNLWQRELLLGVYQPILFETLIMSSRRIWVLVFVSRRNHVQYVEGLCPEQVESIIHRARGKSGDNASYIKKSVEELRRARIIDKVNRCL